MQEFLFYLQLGWEHIISPDALDHQLFILALVATFSLKDFKQIFILVTAFTIGHSITLFLSVLDVIRIPSDWVEFLIPFTIVCTALDNLLLKNKSQYLAKANYLLALCFGLIHGMGFANVARMTLASEQKITVPLLGFNVGLELGQILVVIVFLIFASLLKTMFRISRRDWILFISSGIFALALKMCIERIPF